MYPFDAASNGRPPVGYTAPSVEPSERLPDGSSNVGAEAPVPGGLVRFPAPGVQRAAKACECPRPERVAEIRAELLDALLGDLGIAHVGEHPADVPEGTVFAPIMLLADRVAHEADERPQAFRTLPDL